MAEGSRDAECEPTQAKRLLFGRVLHEQLAIEWVLGCRKYRAAGFTAPSAPDTRFRFIGTRVDNSSSFTVAIYAYHSYILSYSYT